MKDTEIDLEAKKKPEGRADKKSRKLKSECIKKKERGCCTEEAEKKQGVEE